MQKLNYGGDGHHPHPAQDSALEHFFPAGKSRHEIIYHLLLDSPQAEGAAKPPDHFTYQFRDHFLKVLAKSTRIKRMESREATSDIIQKLQNLSDHLHFAFAQAQSFTEISQILDGKLINLQLNAFDTAVQQNFLNTPSNGSPVEIETRNQQRIQLAKELMGAAKNAEVVKNSVAYYHKLCDTVFHGSGRSLSLFFKQQGKTVPLAFLPNNTPEFLKERKHEKAISLLERMVNFAVELSLEDQQKFYTFLTEQFHLSGDEIKKVRVAVSKMPSETMRTGLFKNVRQDQPGPFSDISVKTVTPQRI